MNYREDSIKDSITHCGVAVINSAIRELKIETFSGRRRLDWQSKPGTEVAVASRQNSNIKIAVNTQKDGAFEDYR